MCAHEDASTDLQLLSIDQTHKTCHLCGQAAFPAILCKESAHGTTLWFDYACAACLLDRVGPDNRPYLESLISTRQQTWHTYSSNNFTLYLTPGSAEHQHLQQVITWEEQDCRRFTRLKMRLATNWLKGVRNGLLSGLTPDMQDYLNFFGNDPQLVEELRAAAYSSDSLLAARLYLKARTRALNDSDHALLASDLHLPQPRTASS